MDILSASKGKLSKWKKQNIYNKMRNKRLNFILFLLFFFLKSRRSLQIQIGISFSEIRFFFFSFLKRIKKIQYNFF